MALLEKISVSFCNIETRNDYAVRVFIYIIFYAYSLLTQILDHNSDFYVEKEVIYWTFSLKN
jgi:hypothetical protein